MDAPGPTGPGASTCPMVNVVVLSPIPALRAGLRALLSGDAELTVVNTAACLDDLPDFQAEECVVVATPGGIDPGDLTLHPGMALLLVSGDAKEMGAFLKEDEPSNLRAWGILSPETTAEALQAAVRALAEGLVTASPDLLRQVLSTAAEGGAADLPPGPSEQGDDLVDHLTERETEVLRLLAQGLTNKQVALALGISEHTVKFHVSSIYGKMGVSTRTEAVRKGARLGWVPL